MADSVNNEKGRCRNEKYAQHTQPDIFPNVMNDKGLMDVDAIRKYLECLNYEGIDKMNKVDIAFLVSEDRAPFLVWLVSNMGAKLIENHDEVEFLKMVLTGYGFCKYEEVGTFIDGTLDDLQQLKIYDRIFNTAAIMTCYPITRKVEKISIRAIHEMFNYRKNVYTKPNKRGIRVKIVNKHKVDISAISTELDDLTAELSSLAQKSMELACSQDKSEAGPSKEDIESLKRNLTGLKETIVMFESYVRPTKKGKEICSKELSEAVILLKDSTLKVQKLFTSLDTIAKEISFDPVKFFPIHYESVDVDELITELHVNWLDDEESEEKEDSSDLFFLAFKPKSLAYVEREKRAEKIKDREEHASVIETERHNIKVDQSFTRALDKSDSGDVGINTLTEELELIWASMDDTTKDNDEKNIKASSRVDAVNENKKGKDVLPNEEEAMCIDDSKFIEFPNDESVSTSKSKMLADIEIELVDISTNLSDAD